MTKRTLPSRSTRGQLPPHLRQSSSPPKITKYHPEDQNEVQRKETESRLKINQLLNLKKYPFGRAVHYFLDLDQFPRASSTISYAVNEYNILKDTYSKDCQFIKESKIGDLMNRKLMGLPINLTGEMPSRKQNKCKNVCYAYLFQIQDKKHNNDRLIYTIKSILKRLPKISTKQLERYDFIKKDSSMQEILSESMELIERKQILAAKLQILQLRKQTSRVNWQFEDKVLFYHALNQRLHNSVVELKNKLTEEQFYRLFFQKQRLKYEFHLKGRALEQSLPYMTHYYYKNVPTLSSASIKEIIEKQRTSLGTKSLSNKFTIQYPVAILDFGREQDVLSFTEFLIARRTFSMGEVHFYEAKTMIKKLFRRDLKLKSEKITSYDQYYKHFRRKYEEICRFKKNQSQEESQQYHTHPLLDKYINQSLGKVCNSNLFKLSQRIDITKKQFVFSMIYFWLCQCMASILPFLAQFPDLLEVIGSDFYPKVCNLLVEAIGSPLAGFIFYIFEALTDLMAKNEPLVNIGTRLLLEYNHNINVCMIWSGQTIENKLQEFLEERKETNFPNKKIKRK